MQKRRKVNLHHARQQVRNKALEHLLEVSGYTQLYLYTLLVVWYTSIFLSNHRLYPSLSHYIIFIINNLDLMIPYNIKDRAYRKFTTH